MAHSSRAHRSRSGPAVASPVTPVDALSGVADDGSATESAVTGTGRDDPLAAFGSRRG